MRHQDMRRWIRESLVAAGWAPLVVFVAHVALALTGAYDATPWLDIPMHWAGGMAIAFFFDHSMRCAVKTGLAGAPSELLWGATVFFATCTSAAGWEIAEWAVGQGQSGEIEDAILDMCRGIAGGMLYLIATRSYGPPGNDPV